MTVTRHWPRTKFEAFLPALFIINIMAVLNFVIGCVGDQSKQLRSVKAVDISQLANEVDTGKAICFTMLDPTSNYQVKHPNSPLLLGLYVQRRVSRQLAKLACTLDPETLVIQDRSGVKVSLTDVVPRYVPLIEDQNFSHEIKNDLPEGVTQTGFGRYAFFAFKSHEPLTLIGKLSKINGIYSLRAPFDGPHSKPILTKSTLSQLIALNDDNPALFWVNLILGTVAVVSVVIAAGRSKHLFTP